MNIDENNNFVVSSQPIEEKETVAETTTAIAPLDTASLQLEAERILNELIAETDINKTKDLTYLFNLNQNKKTMVRVSKQSELLDLLTDKTIERVKDKPDNLSNDDLVKLMKTVADLIEKGTNQINREEPAPLIQVNQQNNEINMDKPGLNRDSREKVKAAVLNLLQGMVNGETADVSSIIDATNEGK